MFMKRILAFCLLTLLIISNARAQELTQQQRMQWWDDAKFGLFIHWGLYSVTAGDWNGHRAKGNEHFMLYERIPVKEYGKIAERFNPVKFNAGEWVKAAKDAGMKYMVITTKHHDGYAMFNSPSNNYNIVKTTPFARDPMKELAAACKKQGLKLCFYYSLGRDWQDPDVPTNWPTKGGRSNTWDYPNEDAKDLNKYIERKVKPQLRELLTQYGPIGIIWFDTPEMVTPAQSQDLKALIRKLQPQCIINSRVGNGLGDYLVSEQKLTAEKDAKPWEACVTMNATWGYNYHDTAWKSPEVLVRQLVEVVAKGGNLLLNIGAMGDGAFPDRSLANLKAIGGWMNINHEAIYGTHRWDVVSEGSLTEAVATGDANAKNTMKDNANDATSKLTNPDVYFTAKDNQVYIFARSWRDSQLKVKAFADGKYPIKNISLLGSASKVKWEQGTNGLNITMPATLPNDAPVYVFKVIL
jgi:alpha-L-fucosidase